MLLICVSVLHGGNTALWQQQGCSRALRLHTMLALGCVLAVRCGDYVQRRIEQVEKKGVAEKSGAKG